MPVYDALYDGGVEHLLCRHEQGAAIAAIGYARATGKTGVCIATSGPVLTNPHAAWSVHTLFAQSRPSCRQRAKERRGYCQCQHQS